MVKHLETKFKEMETLTNALNQMPTTKVCFWILYAHHHNLVLIINRSWILTIRPKWLENSKWALVCCSDEWRGWCGAQRVKIAFQPLLSSIRANWEFSSNCGVIIDKPHSMSWFETFTIICMSKIWLLFIGDNLWWHL